MPSGSRKRKAAKKKKGLESHAPNSSKAPQINENDDLKHHDGKESDGEDDLANPQHQSTDEEEKGDAQSSGVENRCTGETEQNGVPVKEAVPDDMVTREDPSEIDVEFNDSSNVVEHVGSEKEFEAGVLSHTVIEEGVVLSETDINEELNKVEHIKDSGEGGLVQGDAGESYVIDESKAVVDDAVPSLLPAGEKFVSVIESTPVEKNIMDSASSKDSFVPNDENLKKEPNALDQKYTSALVHEDAGLGSKNDEVVGATSATVQETREILLTDITRSDDAANHANANNGSDHLKRLEVHDSSVNQPLLGSAAQPVQKTSWMSCCGLLDAFPGSNR